MQLPSTEKRRRRKSLSIFRTQLNALATIRDDHMSETNHHTRTMSKQRGKYAIKSRQETPSSPLSKVSTENSFEKPPALQIKSKQKVRPKSIFGSLSSHYSFDEEKELMEATMSDTISADDSPSLTMNEKTVRLLHHGEVQVAGSMFRKKTQYLVLTNTHLLRFKTQARAREVFPDIPDTPGRIPSNHLRVSSTSSGSETHPQTNPQTMIPLQNMVAVYKSDDGRPFVSIELASYDETTNSACTTSILLNDSQDADLWLSCLQAAVTKSRLSGAVPFSQTAIEYVVRYLETESDYLPSHFRMFIITQLTSKSGGRSSADDLHRPVSSMLYLVIGLYKIHLIPLPRHRKPGSSTSLSDFNGISYGIASLSAINFEPGDDTFHLSFRSPLQPCSMLYLASASAQDIALCLRQAADYIRPLWIEQPFCWQVPANLEENLLPALLQDGEDHLAFDRTLIAYCVSYHVDPSNIRYTVDFQCEDAPEFTLLEPNDARRTRYNSFELLAILRALRYNESFHSISFRQVKLDALHNICDRFGAEHFSWSSKSGQKLPLPKLDSTPLLVQELQCLALKNTKLRRVDFSYCITRRPTDFDERDRGSGICEAIFPLCTLQLTNIDWVSLNGIALSYLDLEYLRAAGCRKACHFRGLELSSCSLGEDLLDFALSNIQGQEDTLECLDLSNNPARIHPAVLTSQLKDFVRIRKLNLSRFSFTSTMESTISESLFLRWRLEVLDISGTALNTGTVDSLAAYLMSQQSSKLRALHLENCNMNGEDIATLLRSLVHDRSEPRKLHLYISGNRLEKNHHELVNAISRSSTPTQLTIQALEYSDEKGFKDLLHALASNKTIAYLDISRVSLPYDASEVTCEMLKFMFENNRTLKELNISGEVAHLEAITLGRGICKALRGLIKNQTLEILRIENQALGFPGAEALATVLETNSTLREIYCENNQIGLQAFSILVNAVKVNESLLWLAAMSKDRYWNRGDIEKEIEEVHFRLTSSAASARSSVRRVLSSAVPGRSISLRSREKHSPSRLTERDVEAAMARIDDSWDAQFERLSGYLTRNYDKLHGTSLSDIPAGELLSQPTMMNSLRTVLAGVSLKETSSVDTDNQIPILTANGIGQEEEMELEECPLTMR